MYQASDRRAEKYNLMNNLAQDLGGIALERIAPEYVDNIRNDLQKVLNSIIKNSFFNVAGEAEEDFISSRRHQLVMLTVHSEPVHVLLDSGFIPDILSERLAKNLNLEIESTEQESS